MEDHVAIELFIHMRQFDVLLRPGNKTGHLFRVNFIFQLANVKSNFGAGCYEHIHCVQKGNIQLSEVN